MNYMFEQNIFQPHNINEGSDEDSLDAFFNIEETNTSWSDGGEVVAACIIAAANLVENRLANSVEKFTEKLELNSQKVIRSSTKNKGTNTQILKVNDQVEALLILTDNTVETMLYDDIRSKRKGVKMVNYTDKARRASEKLKQNTENITTGIRGTTTEAIFMISERADEVDVAGKFCPNPEGKEAFYATGKVAVSGLGAAGRVFDALYLSTKEVAKKGCEVTADVARHKYGEDAGKLVENTGQALGNTLRTLHLLTQMHGGNFAKAVARDTGKAKLNRTQSRNSNGSVKSMNSAGSCSKTNDSISEQRSHRKESSGKSKLNRKQTKTNNGSTKSVDTSSRCSTNASTISEQSSRRKENIPSIVNKSKEKRKHHTYDI